MIANLDVSKINAGDISTNKFRIVSDSGKMLIADNTIQIKDNNRVRVQIGKDASNDYSMYVWDSSGKLMFDATGLKADGIKNKIIRDDMISDNANIDGGKINITSLITEVNKDTNTSTIKSTKIMLNNQNQTLEVAFNSLKTQADGTKSLTESHSTTIGVMQGQITTAINNTQIVKDGQTILLKDDYNRTVKTIDSMKSTIGSHTSQISDLNSTVSTQGSSIEQLKGQIALKVESTDITNAINGIQIGVTNIQRNSGFVKDTSWWQVGTGYSRDINTKYEDTISMKFLRTGLADSSISYLYSGANRIKAIEGETYTVSAKFFTNNSSSIDVPIFLGIWFYNASGGLVSSEGRKDINIPFVNNKWIDCNVTLKAPVGTTHVALVIGARKNGTFWVARPKVEKGNKPTDWSPALEDVQTQIDTNKTEISSTKSKVSTIETNLTGITQRVSTVENKQTTVDGKITSLQTRMQSAEQKLTKEGLTTIISNHYTTSNDVNGIVTSKGYQTHSQVQQTVDKLQIKFTQSGGYNKLYNSAFLTGDLKRWGNQGTCTRSVVNSTSSGFAKVLKLTTTGVNQGVYQTVTGLKVGKKYTLSGMVNPHADGGKCALMIGNNGKWLGVYTKANAGWENLSVTFTAESDSVTVYLSTAGGGTAGTHYYTGIMLTDGELELPWSPHPSEVYEGITSIDKDGITVESSKVKSKTTINANGFKIIKTDTNEEVFKVNSSGRLELYGIFRTRNGERKSGYFGENQVTFYNWWSDSNEAIAFFYGGKTSDNKRSADVVGKDIVSLGIGEPGSGTKVLEGSSSNLKIYKNTNFNDCKITNLNAINEDAVSKDLWINKIYLRTNQINSSMDSGYLHLNYWRGGTATSSTVKVCDGTNSGTQGTLQCGNFKAYGTKNACVQTDIGYVDINAYETADYYFGDIGETILGNDGYSYVYIDSLFAQTVNTTRKYQVFLSIYGEGYANVIERTPNYFVIKGTPGIEIGYEIKAKRKGYEDYRLERDVNSFIKGKEHGLDLDYKVEKSKFENDLTKSIQGNLNLENKELILVIDKNLEKSVRNKELINIVEEGVIYEDIN